MNVDFLVPIDASGSLIHRADPLGGGATAGATTKTNCIPCMGVVGGF